jgi:histidinol-phosphatase (PHP family)
MLFMMFNLRLTLYLVYCHRKGGEKMSYISDTHVHSDQSKDAVDSVMALCEEAIEKGLSEIIVTDHYEPRPSGNDNAGYSPMQAWLEVRRARLRYGRNLGVRLGVELGQPHLYPEESLGIIASVPYDYILASVHTTRDGKTYFQRDYTGQDIRDIRETYLTDVLNLVRWGQFDGIAHLDVPARYTDGKAFDITRSADLTRTVLKEIIHRGKALELNTKGWTDAKGKEHFSPDIRVLEWYRELGGEMITLGSDAHKKRDLGRMFGRAAAMLADLGFTHTVSFTDRTPVWISLTDGSRRMKEICAVV